MPPLARFSRLLKDVPPVSHGRLVMPAVFIGTYTALRALMGGEDIAFVWAGVLAQAAQTWGVLPLSLWREGRLFDRPGNGTALAVAVLFSLMVVQIWWAEPWFSQRLVSAYCAAYAGLMVLGVSGDRDVLDGFTPVRGGHHVPLAFRRHLLRLYALVAILVLAVNESLLILDAPLGTRVATLSVLPVALHYVFQIALRLTCPPLDGRDR